MPMERIRTYARADEAGIAMALLRAEGIPAVLRNNTMNQIMPLSTFEVELWVHPSDAERVKHILDVHPPDEVEDYREISAREIAWLRQRQRRGRYRLWLWIGLALLILLLLVSG